MSKLQEILSVLLKEAGAVVPVFVHNPKSKEIEAIVLATAEDALNALNATKAGTPKFE